MWTVSSLCHVSTGGRRGGRGRGEGYEHQMAKSGTEMGIFEKENETNYTTTRILVFDRRQNM